MIPESEEVGDAGFDTRRVTQVGKVGSRGTYDNG
jgi:hypothetical protein